MLQNFFTTALRTIVKNKAYASINFIGLTTGVALSLLIIAYVRSELSYDTFHEKVDRLYRIRYDVPNGLVLATSPPPITPVMKDFFPEVEEVGRVYGRNVSIKRPNATETFEETGVFFADSSIMNMFSFQFVQGSPQKALTEKFKILITEEMAVKYFGSDSPIGEPLLFGGNQLFTVAGVVKDFPENSHLRFHMLVPYENMFDLETAQTAAVMRKNLEVNFVISHGYTYVMLKPGADSKNVDKNMDAFIKKYALPQVQVGQKFSLFPVRDIHLKSTMMAEPSPTNTMTNLWIFIAVGILTILIACINYVNLSTAQSFSRIKEIGLRKILGAMRLQVIIQFMAESFLFCLVAFGLGFGVFYFALPWMNALTGKALVFSDTVDATMVVMSLALLLLITLLAGGYPAIFVARFQSVSALKSGTTPMGNQLLRKTLVVLQLAIACALLSGSLIINKQLNYMANKPLGFDKENIITIPLFSENLNGIFSQRDSSFQTRLQSLRNSIEEQTGVRGTTLSTAPPGMGATYRGTVPEGFSQEQQVFAANLAVDYDFLDSYQLQLAEGRFFSRDFISDVKEGFIINETAVQEFKWGTPAQAIGKTINREGKIGKVVGVVKDFNFSSLTSAVSGLVMELNPNQLNILSVRFENNNTQTTLDKIATVWNSMFPEKSFEFTFLDEQLNEQYSNFQNFGTVIQVFTLTAVLIACLGVYGLVLFVVQRKVKEIGVRKVLGASVMGILKLIYRDFAILIVLGFMVGIPISYYLLQEWMKNFIYHTNIDALTYLLSLTIVLVVTAATISYQAVRASLANPVDSLRSE